MTRKDHFAIFDRPDVLAVLFHPRTDFGRKLPPGGEIHDIETDNGIRIGSRFYLGDRSLPHILFFHGNGEIAEDYDDIGPIYNAFGLNFMVADFRGYGRSSGMPSVSNMFSDAYRVADFIFRWRDETHRTGPLWVMGRSLGSAPAIELAAAFPEKFQGLIIESGFSDTLSLLSRLGLDPEALNIGKTDIFSNTDTLIRYPGPTLILHGEFDQIIPVSHAQDLFQESPSPCKNLKIIEKADHNTILMMAGRIYFETIRDFITEAAKRKSY